MKTEDFVLLMVPPKVEESHAYKMGFDCGTNGANEENCHFSIFSSPENTQAWKKGKADAEKQA